MFWRTDEEMEARQIYRWQWLRCVLINRWAMGLPHINTRLRKALMRLGGITIGEGGFIGMDGWYEECYPHRLIIGDNVTISFRVTLVAHGPRRTDDMRVIIEDDVYIGCNTTVLAGVTIGRGARVGAGSVVAKNVAPGTTVAGVPARVLHGTD